MHAPQNWRELLGRIIKEPGEQERLARVMGIDVQTLLDWISQQKQPSAHQLALLIDEVPRHRALLRTLIREEFDDITDGISATFSAHILDLYHTTPDEARFWTLCGVVLAEALKQLDTERLGLSISVVQCMAALSGSRVHYLRDCVGLGTYPWEEQIELRTRFLGAESLAGYAISSGCTQIIADSRLESRLTTNLPEFTLSAVAIPILHSQRVAGCLLVASTQSEYFRVQARLNLITEYAALLMLAFSPEEFYPVEQIALQIMPTFQVQQPYLSALRQRVQATWRTAFSAQRSMSYLEAQQYVWWQVAEELLQFQSPQSPSI